MASDACSPRFSPPAHRPHPEHTLRRLYLVPSTPPGDEGARERSVENVDRHRVVKHPAHARWRHRPAIRAAVLIELGGYVSMSLAETFRWNTDPDADREAPLGHRDHVARVTWHFVFLVRSHRRSHGRFFLSRQQIDDNYRVQTANRRPLAPNHTSSP
jgi:hypothetical protein